jgi:type IV secretion system protein VirD4
LVEDWNSGSGGSTSSSNGHHPSTNRGTSWNQGSSTRQHQRRKYTPDEILAADPRTCFSFVPSMRPLMTRLIRYYEEKSLFQKDYGVATLWRSICFALAALFFAACVTYVAAEVSKNRPSIQRGGVQ